MRNWGAQGPAWSTKAVRDAFYASPKFPRVTDADLIRQAVVEGVRTGKFGDVSLTADGSYQGEPVIGDPAFEPGDVEFSEQVVLLREVLPPPERVTLTLAPLHTQLQPEDTCTFALRAVDSRGNEVAVPDAKWSATGATVDPSGRFQAGQEEGEFTVRATAGDLEAVATVKVAAGKPPSPGVVTP